MRYRILICLLALLFFSATLKGAFDNENKRHSIIANIPFCYFDYPYISLDMGYRSPSLLKNIDLFAKGTFRSYGVAFWTFQGGYQDLKAEAEARYIIFSNKTMEFQITGSGGLVWNFNTRTGEMGIQPLIAPGIMYRFYCVDITIPVQMRFYNDGIIIRPVIEIGFWVSRVKIYYSLELTFSTSYDSLRKDFYGYNTLGVMIVI